METMNIALPEALKRHVKRRVVQGGYGSVSEYIRELIRRDQAREAWSALEVEVAKGLASGPAEPMTREDWNMLRQVATRRAAD